jgi:hypothetical protein
VTVAESQTVRQTLEDVVAEIGHARILIAMATTSESADRDRLDMADVMLCGVQARIRPLLGPQTGDAA